jgi:hypothetical protein
VSRWHSTFSSYSLNYRTLPRSGTFIQFELPDLIQQWNIHTVWNAELYLAVEHSYSLNYRTLSSSGTFIQFELPDLTSQWNIHTVWITEPYLAVEHSYSLNYRTLSSSGTFIQFELPDLTSQWNIHTGKRQLFYHQNIIKFFWTRTDFFIKRS